MICSGPSVVFPSFVSSPLFFRGFGLFGKEEKSLRGVEGDRRRPLSPLP